MNHLSHRAQTPEELETLFEDLLMLRDRAALAAIFEDLSVFVSGDRGPVCGAAATAQQVLTTWNGTSPYVADPRHVVQARDIALIVADRAISVARRTRDGAWRYAIVLRTFDDGAERRTQ